MWQEPMSDDVLAPLVTAHVAVAPDELRFVRCPTGKFNTTYFVEGAPQPMVLRIAPPDDPSRVVFYEYRMMRREPGLHARLREATGAPVPCIIAGDFSGNLIDRDYLLMERLPGTPISDHASLTRETFDRVLGDVGRVLRAVHNEQAASYGYLGAHAPMEAQADWNSAFVMMWNRLLDDVRDCGGYSAEEADSLRRLLDRHIDAFDRQAPASLLHMDVWAQNILADEEGQLTGLLDWDRALYGDPEIEFAVLDYCGISEPAFWEGYGRPRDTSPAAQFRRLFYLLYELQKYIVIRRVRHGQPDQSRAYRDQALQLAERLM